MTPREEIERAIQETGRAIWRDQNLEGPWRGDGEFSGSRRKTPDLLHSLVDAVLEEAARACDIHEVRVPEPIRGCNMFRGEDADGWRPLLPEEDRVLRGVVGRIRALKSQPAEAEKS